MVSDQETRETSSLIRGALPVWPTYAADERAAVDRVLSSGKVNYWTGQEGRAFEAEFAASVGVQHGIALANGTLALELALRAFEIRPGDEVIVTPRSFIASTSAAVLLGAVPVFADVDPDSQNVTAATIRRVITKRTRAIVPVHLAGWPCEMPAIMQVAEEHGLKVVEDCAQANGATLHGRAVGSFGHAAAFSFCQDKIITTGGEGGMLVTNDSTVWERSWAFKDHGKNWASTRHKAPGVEFRWLHDSFGSNYRLTEMQAVIGRQQLAKLPDWQRTRERNALRLANALAAVRSIRVPLPGADLRHAWYRLYAFVVADHLHAGWSRDRIVAEIAERGVPCFVGSCPEIYREKAFAKTGWSPPERLPTARALGESAICFLVHPTLNLEHIDVVARIAGDVLMEATKP